MKRYFFAVLFFLGVVCVHAQHPSIMLTKKGVDEVRAGINKYPLLTSSFKTLKAEADKAVSSPVNVPAPADGGGGITHEQHKKNYQNVLACGTVYQLTKDMRYADYVKNILLQYASLV
jgi:hypothetical protein